jgi:hypothetical protein
MTATYMLCVFWAAFERAPAVFIEIAIARDFATIAGGSSLRTS